MNALEEVRRFLDGTWAPWKLQNADGSTLNADTLRDLLDRLERADRQVAAVKALADEWESLPVWGPDERGLFILDEVDHDGLMRDLRAALATEEAGT